MTITWTSGYDINEALPFVEWGSKWGPATRSPAGTLTFNRGSMCGMILLFIISARSLVKLSLQIRYLCFSPISKRLSLYTAILHTCYPKMT